MNKTELVELVQNFRSLGREGGYWDFKKEWHKNKAELLLDIICMANNMEDRDAYIILGIHDQTMEVVGVDRDPNRRTLNSLSQFVAGKNFAVYTPEVDMQTIELENCKVDIIIIRNGNHTPYYLETDFSDEGVVVHHGKVYVRLNDRKAGKDRVAPYSCIEHLWKKRFGINLSVMERLSLLLNETDKWIHDWGNKKYAYHIDYPEFRMQYEDEMCVGWCPAAAFYAHPGMHFSRLDILYHNTIIYETELWVFDEYRLYLPKSTNCKIDHVNDFWYSYYDLSTIEGKLLTIFTNGTNNISSREPNYHQILIFKNTSEKKEFDAYLAKHFDDVSDQEIHEEFKFQIDEDKAANGGGLIYSAFQVAKVAKIYTKWLSQKQ